MDPSPGSAAWFAVLSRDLVAAGEEHTTRTAVLERAVALLPACRAAGLSWRADPAGERESVATSATDDATSALDQAQHELGEGPAVELLAGGEPTLWAPDLAASRWTRWAPRVLGTGATSVLGVRLESHDGVLGALTLYAAGQPFSEDDLELASVYAVHAATALSAAHHATRLRTAVHTRHSIGIAQGIVMQTHGLDLEESSALLARHAEQLEASVVLVAQHVVAHGSLPDTNTGT